jgi:hypothetical protein
MTTRERTAYPQFKQSQTAAELTEFYTLTDEELMFVQQNAKGNLQRLTLTLLLKCFQKLGYLPKVQTVPTTIIEHIAAPHNVVLKRPLTNVPRRTRVRY